MSVLKYSLITLPIHHYSYEIYRERHNAYVEKEKKSEERYWGVPFEQLSEETKRTWENLWWWPPWKYNDIVGFLEIGMDIGDHMTADIYLIKKYLPKNHPNKRYGNKKKTHDILYFREVHKIPVREKKKKSYIETLKKILNEARKTIKKRNRYFEIFIPSYDLDCIDLARAHEQFRERAEYE